MHTVRNVLGAFLIAALSLAPFSQSAMARTHHKHHAKHHVTKTMTTKRTKTMQRSTSGTSKSSY